MITEEELKSLQAFGKEEDGSYCDRWAFSIKNLGQGWVFCHFNEVNGDLYPIKKLKDMADLKRVYEAISDEELIIESNV